jgi:hypothetical protein
MASFTTIPDTSSRNNVDLHQAPSSDGALPQEPLAPPSPPRPEPWTPPQQLRLF